MINKIHKINFNLYLVNLKIMLIKEKNGYKGIKNYI